MNIFQQNIYFFRSTQILSEPEQSGMLDTLQRTTCVGELSAFDIEKYLKRADVSGSSDASMAQTTFELTGWANDLSSCHRNPEAGRPEEQGSSAQQAERVTLQTPSRAEPEHRGGETVDASSSLSPGYKGHSRRSSIPRPSTSFSSAGRSVGSGQTSTAPPPADKMTARKNTCASAGRTLTEKGVKPGELNPEASKNTKSYSETSRKNDNGPAVSSGLPKTPPGSKNGKASLPCFKGSSSPPHRGRSAGQQDRYSHPPEKKPAPARNITAAPPPRGSLEKRSVFSPVDSGE